MTGPLDEGRLEQMELVGMVDVDPQPPAVRDILLVPRSRGPAGDADEAFLPRLADLGEPGLGVGAGEDLLASQCSSADAIQPCWGLTGR
jgi:hypothetical protein